MNDWKTTSIASVRAGLLVGLGVDPCEVRNEERPAHQAEELDGGGQHADGSAGQQHRVVCAVEHLREQHSERQEEHGGPVRALMPESRLPVCCPIARCRCGALG